MVMAARVKERRGAARTWGGGTEGDGVAGEKWMMIQIILVIDFSE